MGTRRGNTAGAGVGAAGSASPATASLAISFPRSDLRERR